MTAFSTSGDEVDFMKSNSVVDIWTWMRTLECLNLTQRFKDVVFTEPFQYVLPQGSYTVIVAYGKGIINISTLQANFQSFTEYQVDEFDGEKSYYISQVLPYDLIL